MSEQKTEIKKGKERTEKVQEDVKKKRRHRKPSERALSRMGLDKTMVERKPRRENVVFEVKNTRKPKVADRSPESIKNFWKNIQNRQIEELKKAKVSTIPAKISHVRIITTRDGEEVVKVSFAGGGSLHDNGARLQMMHDIRRKMPPPDRIYLLMIAIKEKGWKAVEGQIPPELRDEVLKACSSAGVSLTMAEVKEETEKRQVQARQAQAAQKQAQEAQEAYEDAREASKKTEPRLYQTYDCSHIDAKRPYIINASALVSREIWKHYAMQRRDNAADKLHLTGQARQDYFDAVEVMQAHKNKMTQLRLSGKLTTELEAQMKRENDRLAREEAYALAVGSGLYTQKEIDKIRAMNLDSKDPRMQKLWDLRDTAQLGTQEQVMRFMNGDKTVISEIRTENNKLKKQNELEEHAKTLGVPVPKTKAETKRLNQDYAYWDNLRRLHHNDMDAVGKEFQSYLQLSEKEKAAERKTIEETLKPQQSQTTKQQTEKQQAAVQQQAQGFAKTAEILGYSAQEIEQLQAMSKDKPEKKAINRAIQYRSSLKKLPLEEQTKKLQEFVALPADKQNQLLRPQKRKTDEAQAKQVQPKKQNGEIAISEQADLVKLSFIKAAFEDKDNSPEFDAMRQALAANKIKSLDDLTDEKKLNVALKNIGKKAYGLEAWNAIREARGETPLTAEQFDAPRKEKATAAQVSEVKTAAPEKQAEKSEPVKEAAPEKQEVKAEPVQAAEPVKAPVSAAQRMQSKGKEADKKQMDERLRNMQTRTISGDVQRKSDRGQQWTRYVQNQKDRA